MSIWGRRDSESQAEEGTPSPAPGDEPQQPAGEQHQAGEPQAGDPRAADPQAAASAGEPQAEDPQAGDPQAEDPQAGDPQAADPQAGDPQAADPQAEEPTAFWRAQGEPPPSPPRAPADAPPQDYGHAPAGPAAPEPAEDIVVLDEEDIVVLDAEAAVKEPGVTGTAGPQAAEPAAAAAPDGPAEPGPVRSEPAGSAVPAASSGGLTPERWSEIMAAFVDDPRGSVKMAADTVGEAIDEFVNSVRGQQQALASSWDGTETDTERLRLALRDYRTLWHRVQQLDL